ncbi:MAG: linear amide C-N hydrolase [Desulfobacteraceae bacterium]|nr:MAG: linear amide C-N hydrolase [Desulfobacteraceae bacterium]
MKKIITILACVSVLIITAIVGIKIVRVTPTASAEYEGAFWSSEKLTPGYPLEKIEVAGTYKQIGYAFGQWYKAKGYKPRPLTNGQQAMARAQFAFYEKVYPATAEQMRGVYAAYGLNLADMNSGIPVYEKKGFQCLLPGVIDNNTTQEKYQNDCSVVFTRPGMNKDGHARLGRNEDWPKATPHTALIFTYPEKGSYPTVIMTGSMRGFVNLDGMNSRGLSLGSASVYPSGYPIPEGPVLIYTQAQQLVLERCANVEEAIVMLRALPIAFLSTKWLSHILLADQGGASVVVEFLPEGIVVSRTDTPYQVMTNNYWVPIRDNKEDCWRYIVAVNNLKTTYKQVDMEGMMAVMSAIRNSTQWSIVYDLQDLSLCLALPDDKFVKKHKFSLSDFIARMEKRKTGGK